MHWLERHSQAVTVPDFSLPGKVHWLGRRGMRWDELVPLLETERRRRIAPQVLVIHVGGNDLGYTKGTSLIRRMIDDLALIMSIYPVTQIVFSYICERRVWMRGTCDAPGLLDKSRRNVNKLVGSFLRQSGMSFLTHSNIRHFMALYRKDGVHLNTSGNAVLMANIIEHVKLVLSQ